MERRVLALKADLAAQKSRQAATIRLLRDELALAQSEAVARARLEERASPPVGNRVRDAGSRLVLVATPTG